MIDHMLKRHGKTRKGNTWHLVNVFEEMGSKLGRLLRRMSKQTVATLVLPPARDYYTDRHTIYNMLRGKVIEELGDIGE